MGEFSGTGRRRRSQNQVCRRLRDAYYFMLSWQSPGPAIVFPWAFMALP